MPSLPSMGLFGDLQASYQLATRDWLVLCETEPELL